MWNCRYCWRAARGPAKPPSNRLRQVLENIYKAQGKSLDTVEAYGLTARQRFFFSYALGWCEDERPEAERNHVTTNPHSQPRFRVDRPLSKMPEFQKAFACRLALPWRTNRLAGSGERRTQPVDRPPGLSAATV